MVTWIVYLVTELITMLFPIKYKYGDKCNVCKMLITVRLV